MEQHQNQHQHIELLPREVQHVLPSRSPKENESSIEDVDAVGLNPIRIFNELKDMSSEWWELARAMGISFNKRTEWADHVQMTNDQRLETAINEWCEIKGFITQHDLTKILRKSGRGKIHIPLKEEDVFKIFQRKADKWEEIQEKMVVQLDNEEIYLNDNEKKSDQTLLRIVIQKWFIRHGVSEIHRDEIIQILEELDYQDLIKEHKPLSVEEVFDEISTYQLNPSEWWEIGGDLSINKDDRKELKENQSLTNDDRLERVIWLSSQQSVLTETKLNHVSESLHARQERLKYKKRILLEHLAIAVVTTVVAMTILLAGCVSLIVLTHQEYNTAMGTSEYINTDDFFVLGTQEFGNNLESINLTLKKGDASVNVYKIDCDQVMELNRTLNPERHFTFSPFSKLMHPFNYRQYPLKETIPLYGIRGRVDFDISSYDGSDSNDTKCTHIYIFDDYNSYDDAIFYSESGSEVNESGCLFVDPYESSSVTRWSYEFNTEQFIYSSAVIEINVHLKANISGYVITHSLPSAARADCHLTKDKNSCSIDVCSGVCNIGATSSDQPKQCIVVKLDEQPDKQNDVLIHYTTFIPSYTLRSFLLILVFLLIVPFIILIAAIPMNFGIYYFRKVTNKNRSIK